MEISRAAQILDPEHRERYESIEVVNEACRMGMEALGRLVPRAPYPDGDLSILACANCGNGEFLHNEDGNENRFCGQCGQALGWHGVFPPLRSERRAVLKYPGSKWRVAEWIVSLMPPHRSYLEPFFGSGAVFFTKEPSRIETINDLDGEVVNLFRCVRENPVALARAISATPYSREEYENAWRCRKSGDPVDGVETARLTLVRYWQGFGSNAIYKGGWKNDRVGREYAYQARYWSSLPLWIENAAVGLKDAQIECSPAVDVIRRFRHSDVLIYADPPYLLSTRTRKQYVVEMEDELSHAALCAALREHLGPVILSGYDNELYDRLLPGWVKRHRKTLAEGGAARVETVWLNYEPTAEENGRFYGRGVAHRGTGFSVYRAYQSRKGQLENAGRDRLARVAVGPYHDDGRVGDRCDSR